MERQQDFFSDLTNRVNGLLPATLGEAHVVIVGAGSVGSIMADGLTRSGVGHLLLIDGDAVEAHNLSRSMYRVADIGLNKAEALARHLLGVNAGAEISDSTCRLQEMDRAKLSAAVRDADLLIAATDDPQTQALINRISQHFGVPAVFVGLYRGAEGGEVVMSMPGLTPCMECYAGSKRFNAVDSVERSKDYGTGRLEGEPGLGSDIAFLTAAATKLALTILSAGSCEKTTARQFLIDALSHQLSVVTFGMVPEYWFYPDVFTTTCGQFAFQSVWLTVTRNPECPACGERRTEENPIAVMAGVIDAKQFTNSECELEKGDSA